MQQKPYKHKSLLKETINNKFKHSIQYHKKDTDNINLGSFKSQGRHKNKSIYSLAIESNILINDIDLHQENRALRADQMQKIKRKSQLGQRQKSKEKAIREFKLQRYRKCEKYDYKNQSRLDNNSESLDMPINLQKQNREKVSLLKRIIEHYNIKSLERSYYSNLINNLGIKINNGLDGKNKFINVKNGQKDLNKTIKHEPTLKIKHGGNFYNSIQIYDQIFHNSLIKIEAQSINQMAKSTFKQKEQEQKAVIHINNNREFQIQKQKLHKATKQQHRRCNNTSFKISKNQQKHSQTIDHKLQPRLLQARLKIYDNMDNCINIKVNKYKQFLFMINLANNVYRDFDISRYDSPFKIFIGSGNNNNLIKAIMKKRFWFQITKNREEANFVWTQLKEDSLFQKQENNHKIYQELQQLQLQKNQKKINKNNTQIKKASTIYCVKSSKETKERTRGDSAMLQNLQDAQELQASILKVDKKQERSSKAQLKYLKSIKNIEVNNLLKIFTVEQASNYIDMMNQFAYKKKMLFYDRIKFQKNIKKIAQETFNNELIHNHLIFNGLLGNKKAMFYMLKEYYTLTNKDVYNTLPLTFHIKKGLNDQQYKQFCNKYNMNKEGKKLNYWIMKPGEFSNRGQGITCTNNIQDVRTRINNLKKLGKNKSLILQEYIVNPLLYNGRKFDIRTYMLVSINNGKIRAYWYQDGYIRTSSYQWRLDQIKDPEIHLTNDAIQKYSSDYGRYEPGNKLTYTELQRYLDTIPKCNPAKTYNFVNEIYPRIKEIASDAVKASFQYLDPARKGNNFEIFGFDFMIDANFKPWLIQINTNPCLQINCPVLERIIPSMVENAFRIGLDPIFPPPMNYSSTYKYNIPENALFYNKFQLIFDQERDSGTLIDLYKNSKVIQNMDDYEQDKEIYNQEGEEINLQNT